MRKFTLLAFLLFAFVGAFAQSIAVKSFRALPMDMTASSLEGKRIDQNGQVAALIKVVTTQTGFTFEGGTLGIVDTKQRNGEIWVWVPRASRKITILHQQLGVLRDYRYPIEIETERTYEMVLTSGTVETVIKEAVRQQYLIFELEPKNATLEVDDKLWNVDADGMALQFVDFGTYTYRVRAANYITDAGVVTVDDPDNPKTVKVKLKPDFAEVTLKVDADAEIWVNNEKKGTRTWTGSLGKGTYKIECKQEGHETTMISKEITSEMNGQTISLPAPTPIYGSLNVESTPIGATIYIDGKEVGKTPKSINEILVGQHEVRLAKDGYFAYKETVVVNKGERIQVKASLNEMVVVPSTTAQKTSKQFVRKPFVIADVAYSVAPQLSFGLTVGSVEKLGWFLNVTTNFVVLGSNYECDDTGEISEMYSDGYTDYTYTDQIKKSRLSCTAGMVVRLAEPISVYFGGGVGYRRLFWMLEDGTRVKNTNHSYGGFSFDGGLLFHFKVISFSVGVQTLGFNYAEAKAGIGFTF